MAVSQRQRTGGFSRRRIWMLAIAGLVGVVVVLAGILAPASFEILEGLHLPPDKYGHA